MMKYKDLYKKIESLVRSLEGTQDERELIGKILKNVVQKYGDVLGIISGRLYVRTDNVYHLVEQIGDKKDLTGLELPMEYLPVKKLREKKYIIMHRNDKGLDANLEKYLVVDTFAAIAFGEGDRYLVSFSVKEPVDTEKLHYSLNVIRFVVNFKLRELSLKSEFLEAREIQLSLLPSYPPEMKGFDIYVKSIPAALVGGDAYDYFTIDEETMGFAVLDAVGHNLPAALQARDVITGLRMGIAGDAKIDAVIKRLNNVIHRSNLASRFASLFYGELEEYGHFVYINAGHPPPLFFTRRGTHNLHRGGMVLGPNPMATYRRGFVFFRPGDILVIYTDGIIESRDKKNRIFGLDRLKRLIRTNRSESSRILVDLIFKKLAEFSGTETPLDDQTLMIIKRTGMGTTQF